MNLRRIFISLAAGILATLAGFRLSILTAPVWVASFIVAKAGVHAKNATLNLTYLVTNILFWSVVTYLALVLSSRHKKRHSSDSESEAQ